MLEYGGILIEYFGIEDDPEYDRAASHKLAAYTENHLDVIPVYPATFNKDWKSYESVTTQVIK